MPEGTVEEPSAKKPRKSEDISVRSAIDVSSEFSKNLAQLPDTSDVLKIILKKKATGEEVAVIENKPGCTGSVRVYKYLLQSFGGQINRQAAYLGLAIYAEHTEDAHLFPGKHGNIDRLLNIVASGEALLGNVEVIPASD